MQTIVWIPKMVDAGAAIHTCVVAAGIDPAPRRDTGPSWAPFLHSQGEALSG